MTNRVRLRTLAEEPELAAPPDELTAERFEREEFERIRATLYMAVVCESIPRRLGKPAEGAALATDKRIARKIANAYRSLWMVYAKLGHGIDPAPAWTNRAERLAYALDAELPDRKAGATVRWVPWFEERRAVLARRERLAAAIALRDGVSLWGVRRVRTIESEARNLARIRAELEGSS